MANSPDKIRLLATLSQMLLEYEETHPTDAVEVVLWFHGDNAKYVWNHETMFNKENNF